MPVRTQRRLHSLCGNWQYEGNLQHPAQCTPRSATQKQQTEKKWRSRRTQLPPPGWMSHVLQEQISSLQTAPDSSSMCRFPWVTPCGTSSWQHIDHCAEAARQHTKEKEKTNKQTSDSENSYGRHASTKKDPKN